MFRKRHRLSGLPAVVLLSAFIWQGCASLRPNPYPDPPQAGKGFELPDEWEGFLGCLGPVFYVAGQVLAGSGGCRR